MELLAAQYRQKLVSASGVMPDYATPDIDLLIPAIDYTRELKGDAAPPACFREGKTPEGVCTGK